MLPLVDGWALAGTARLPHLGDGAQAGYRLEVDAAWVVRGLVVRPAGWAGDEQVRLIHDGSGGWRDGQGRALDSLDGCDDVWLGFSPAGVTPLVRRLDLPVGQRAEVQVVRLGPDLWPNRVRVAVEHRDVDEYGLHLDGRWVAVHLGPQSLVAEVEGAWKAVALG